MNRLLSLLVPAMLGVTAGATGTVLLRSGFEPAETEIQAVNAMPSGAVDRVQPIDVQTLSTNELSVADRADLLGSLAQTSAQEAAVLFETAARLPPSRQRTLLMGTALARIAAEDSARALTIASESFIDARTAREIGLVLFDSLEPTLENIETIVDSLPQIDGLRFSLEALAQLAATAPDRAADLALNIGNRGHRSNALSLITRTWVGRDAQAALGHIDAVDDPVSRQIFEMAVLSALARADRATAQGYIEARYASTPGERDRLLGVMGRAIVASDPVGALAIAEELEGRNTAPGLARSAAVWLARLNPEAAKAHVRGLSDDYSSQDQRAAVARVLGEEDPDGAIAWLRTFEPIPEDLAGGVLEGISRVDPVRVIDLAEQIAGESSGVTSRAAGTLLVNAGTQQLSAVQIADRILAMEDPAQREQWLSSATQAWAERNSEEAFNWLLGNQGRVGETPFISLARSISNEDPARALEYAASVPAEFRDAWVSSALADVAERDPAGAIGLVSEYRGRPVYDAAAAIVASSVAATQPEQAAVLLATVNDDKQAGIAELVGRGWARRDLQAAELWSTGLTDGPVRDAALRGVVMGLGGRAPSPAIMSLLSSDQIRQQVALDAVRMVARRDQAAARGLIDQYLSDPSFRRRAEQYLREASR